MDSDIDDDMREVIRRVELLEISPEDGAEFMDYLIHKSADALDDWKNDVGDEAANRIMDAYENIEARKRAMLLLKHENELYRRQKEREDARIAQWKQLESHLFDLSLLEAEAKLGMCLKIIDQEAQSVVEKTRNFALGVAYIGTFGLLGIVTSAIGLDLTKKTERETTAQ